MNRDSLIGLGLIGTSFMGVGALIGGSVVNKINNRSEEKIVNIWKDVANTFREQLLKAYENNEYLKKQFVLKEEA